MSDVDDLNICEVENIVREISGEGVIMKVKRTKKKALRERVRN